MTDSIADILREKVKALETELSMVRTQANRNADRAEMADRYELWMTDIGKSIGCGHVDERLARCVEDEIDRLRSALLPFAAAASRPGRLKDCMTGHELENDVILGLGVKVYAWKRAAEICGST